MVLHKCPTSPEGKVGPLGQLDRWGHDDDGQVVFWVPLQVGILPSSESYETEKLPDVGSGDLGLGCVLGRQVWRNRRIRWPEPILGAALVKVDVGTLRAYTLACGRRLLRVACGRRLRPIPRGRRHADGQALLVKVDPLLGTGAEILRASVGVVGHLVLAHLFADLCHEGPVELAAQLGGLVPVPEVPAGAGILALHVVEHLVERRGLALALAVLAAVLAAVHFRLVFRRDRGRVGVALQDDAGQREVRVHDLAVAAQVHPPEIRPQSVLRDRRVAGLADEVAGVAVAAVPHVQRAPQQLRARLGLVRRAQWIGIVVVVKLLGAHYPGIVLETLVRLLAAQQIPDVCQAKGSRVRHGLVHPLGHVGGSLLALRRFVRVPLIDVLREKVNDVPDVAGDLPPGHEAGLL